MTSFAELGIDRDILEGLASLGFEAPTPVQEKVIPLILNQQSDLVSLAQTGTGKTAAFGVPLVQLTEAASRKTQALVLCPTRELCMQVAKDMSGFARYAGGIRVLAVYGGASIEQQIRGLRQGVQIIVATPGRLHDLMRRGQVDISGIRTVVLDEADEMLQMGFQDELNAILAYAPEEKMTMLFSATMSGEVKAIARNYMNDAREITIGQRNAGAENVRHQYYMVRAKDRYAALKRLVDYNPKMYSIVFCRTRQETKDVADKLIQDGYSADALHGDLSQAQRDQVMNKFRRKNLQILVATDVAARGLDVNDLSHVINYNLPDDVANYTHRSGRTGRAGRSGISIALIHLKERYRIKEIEKRVKKRFEEERIPSGKEICQKQLASFMEKVMEVEVDDGQMEPLMPTISETLASLDREELIKRIIALESSRFLEYYRNAPDLNPPKKAPEKRQKFDKNFATTFKHEKKSHGFTRFFLNVGKRDGVLPQRLIGEINEVPGVPRIKIGKIEIKKNSALLEADSRFIPQVLGAFQHLRINGKPVSIEVASPQRPQRPKQHHVRGNKNKGRGPGKPWRS